MVVISNKMSVNEALRHLEEMKKKKRPFNASKHCGAVKFDEDALVIQKRLRSEWD